MDLTPVGDAIELIRRHPQMYMRGGDCRPEFIAEAIAGDALVLGASRVLVFRVPPHWWAVAADCDWLTAPCRCPARPPECFRRIVAFPEAGVNAMRQEVLATAFAPAVVSCTPDARDVISGTEAVGESVWRDLLPFGYARAVAFAWLAAG